MLTVKQAAAHACVCESITRAWVKRGLLPHFRMSASGKPGQGKILIQVEDLDGVMAGFKLGAKEPEPAPAPVNRPRSTFKHLKF
ncbi:hypothetical protein GobsT_51340 [Gemmata obscuriglobus]|uniref:DNA-binding protein n=1 Tax=Gemmata obscuriglobus TaxID=114 RepID=A0A2Z3H5S2_9BACT|nr:helix-turn-helix domain-containing protein [Gemmata obscuriglobus]AWM36984.1 DNA-binding protein [Gemmata obscuriglobus]QEG30329.1 hypothetical protein GobsT_51340 [Gemmata obscuriglobus]VTS09653.1 unnamed protein product [Gemmata obscuriglobus UQM 2246]